MTTKGYWTIITYNGTKAIPITIDMDGLLGKVQCYKQVGCSMNIMGQSACLVVNPITVDSYGFLFNCKTVGQASDLMTALT